MTKHVLVTGASKGIGLATARLLADRGYSVFAGIRREEDALHFGGQERSAADLGGTEQKGALPGTIVPIILDVADEESRRRAGRQLATAVGDDGLYALVNNAGIAVAAPLEFVPLEELQRQFQVNVFGLIGLCRLTLPLLRHYRAQARRAAGAGSRGGPHFHGAAGCRGDSCPRILNMSSIGGRIAFSPSGPYTASKFAVEALTDTLRLELEPQGILISAVEPGTVRTPLWDKAVSAGRRLQEQMPAEAIALYGERISRAMHHAETAADRGIAPERVARRVEHALSSRRPKTRYLVGPDARLARRFILPLPDRLRDRLIRLRG
jgi:NAD(P)-dependent dehydrogenase (short-subunit alcohol dehydrogenase family)